MSDFTPEQIGSATELLATNADRLTQISINMKKLLTQVTPQHAISVIDTDKLRLGGYSVVPVPEDKQLELVLRKNGEDIKIFTNTPGNYLKLVQEGHKRVDQDFQRIDSILNESGTLAHKMHLAFNVHNGNKPLSYRRYRDNPANVPDEQGMLDDLGVALQDAAVILRHAQSFTGQAPLSSDDREQAKHDGEFLLEHQPGMAQAGALLARHNAINDLDRDRKLKISDTIKQHGHRSIAEQVDRHSRLERGMQYLDESQRSAEDDPSFQKRMAKRIALPMIDDDTPKR